jgi:hypothetical protein
MQVLSTGSTTSISGGIYYKLDNLELQILEMVKDFADHAGDQKTEDKYTNLYSDLLKKFMAD